VTPEEITTVVVEALARHSGIDPASIDPATTMLEEIGLDSLDASELLVRLEQRTGRTFDLTGAAEASTVGDLIDVILATAGDLSMETA
jgi:acyl carrier protein